MKKYFLGFVAMFLISFATTAQTSDNALIGKAKGAARECLQDAPQGWNINGSVETVGICFIDGYIKRVTLSASFNCTSEICPYVADMLLATVDFDCDGKVISYTCY